MELQVFENRKKDMNGAYKRYLHTCCYKNIAPKSFEKWRENFRPKLRSGQESKEYRLFMCYSRVCRKNGQQPKRFEEWQEMRKDRESLMHFDEIAKILGLSVDSVKYTYKQAMIKLKNNHRLQELHF